MHDLDFYGRAASICSSAGQRVFAESMPLCRCFHPKRQSRRKDASLLFIPLTFNLIVGGWCWVVLLPGCVARCCWDRLKRHYLLGIPSCLPLFIYNLFTNTLCARPTILRATHIPPRSDSRITSYKQTTVTRHTIPARTIRYVYFNRTHRPLRPSAGGICGRVV